MTITFTEMADHFKTVAGIEGRLQEEEGTVGAQLQGYNESFYMSSRVLGPDEDGEHGIEFTAIDGITVPEHLRSPVYELINFINVRSSMRMGKFVMFPASGRIMYTTVLCACDSDISASQFQHAFHETMSISDYYAPAFQKFMWGTEITPEQACEYAQELAGQHIRKRQSPPVEESQIPDTYADQAIDEINDMISSTVDASRNQDRE